MLDQSLLKMLCKFYSPDNPAAVAAAELCHMISTDRSPSCFRKQSGRKQLKSLNDLKVSVVVNFDQNLVFERLSIKSSTELYTNQL